MCCRVVDIVFFILLSYIYYIYGIVVSFFFFLSNVMMCNVRLLTTTETTHRTTRKAREASKQKKREKGFDLNLAKNKLPKYNALLDSNLRHHFESGSRQKQLYKMGLVSADKIFFSFARTQISSYTHSHTHQHQQKNRLIEMDTSLM